MPIFSVIFVFALLYIFSLKDRKEKYLNLLLLTVILNLWFLQGYFIKIGNKEIITCGNLADRVLFFYSLYYLYVTRSMIPEKIKKRFFLMLIIPLVGILLEVIFPFNGELLPYDAEHGWDGYVYGEYGKVNYIISLSQMLINYIKMAIVWFDIVAIKIICDKNDIIKLCHKMIITSYIVIWYGYFEFFLKNIISVPMLTYEFTAIFFGRNETSIWAEPAKKGTEWFVLQGFTREPSHFVIVLFLISISMIIYNKIIDKGIVLEKKYSIRILVGNCVLMYLTGGFSAIWCIGMLWGCYALVKFDAYRASPKRIIKIATMVMLLFTVIYSIVVMLGNEYVRERLDNLFMVFDMITDNPYILLMLSGDVSTVARLVSIFDTFQVAIQRPLFGLGIGVQWAHDILATMLADFGIIGIITWFCFVTSGDRKYDYILVGVIFFVWGLPFGIGILSHCFYALLIEATSIYSTDRNLTRIKKGEEDGKNIKYIDSCIQCR